MVTSTGGCPTRPLSSPPHITSHQAHLCPPLPTKLLLPPDAVCLDPWMTQVPAATSWQQQISQSKQQFCTPHGQHRSTTAQEAPRRPEKGPAADTRAHRSRDVIPAECRLGVRYCEVASLTIVRDSSGSQGEPVGASLDDITVIPLATSSEYGVVEQHKPRDRANQCLSPSSSCHAIIGASTLGIPSKLTTRR
jgi:hypothetical protein